VTCRDVEGLIIPYASGAAVPPDAAAHIAGCEHCRRLAGAIAGAGQVAPPSRNQLERFESAILADLKPVKPLAPTSVRFIALILVLAVVAAVGSAALGPAGWRALGLLQRVAVFTALAAAAGLLAFSVGRQAVPGSRLLVSPYWLVAVVLGVMTAIVAGLFHPHREAAFVSTGLVCLRIGLECAIPTALLFWLPLRRGAILNPMLTGASAGALAGLGGLTVLEIICPNLNQYHILIWHLGAALVSALAGLVIGSIMERSGWRRVRRTS